MASAKNFPQPAAAMLATMGCAGTSNRQFLDPIAYFSAQEVMADEHLSSQAPGKPLNTLCIIIFGLVVPPTALPVMTTTLLSFPSRPTRCQVGES